MPFFNMSTFKLSPNRTQVDNASVDVVDISMDAVTNPKDYASIHYFENMVSELLKAIAFTPPGTMDYLMNWMSGKEQDVRKNASKSIKLRQDGNKLYGKSKILDEYLEMLAVYNESIAFAPCNSEELALAYGNRAMVFFRLKYFKESLADINRALCQPCPDKTMGKLLIKKVCCMKILDHPDLLNIYNDTLKWIDQHAANVQEKKKELEQALEEAASVEAGSSVDTQFRDDYLEQLKLENPTLEKVQFGRDGNGDLALIAAKDISVGEVVAVQKNYSQSLLTDKTYLTCCQCSMICLNLIPCQGCARATYCSDLCKAEAWSKYHETECKIMYLTENLTSDYVLAMKICITAAKQLGGILPLMKEVYKMSKTEDMKKEHHVVDGAYPPDSYRNVYFMINNRVIPEEMNHCDHVVKISTCVYFLATRTNFFNQQYQSDFYSVMKERMPTFLASLILRHVILLNQVRMTTGIMPINFEIGITAVCPLFHNLIHSCNPKSITFTYKDHQIVVAVENIKKGQEINFSYSNWALVTKSEATRNKFIREYFKYPCECDVCVKQIPSKLIPLKSLDKNQFDVKELAEIFRDVTESMSAHWLAPYPKTAAEYLERIKKLNEMLRSFFAKAPPFCQEVISCKKFLINEYNLLHSRVYRFINSLEEKIK